MYVQTTEAVFDVSTQCGDFCPSICLLIRCPGNTKYMYVVQNALTKWTIMVLEKTKCTKCREEKQHVEHNPIN